MSFLENLKIKAQKNLKTIILAEGEDERHIKAAKNLSKEKVLKKIILLGDETKILQLAKKNGLVLGSNIIISDIKTNKNKDKYIDLLYNKIKKRGMTLDNAKQLIENKTIYNGAAMLSSNEADGMVGGALYTTAEVIKATLTIVGLKENVKTLSSVFFMIHKNKTLFEDGICCFADCAVIPNPSSEQLADIAISSAASFKTFVGKKPKVALLSFSSNGSAKHPMVNKVSKAYKILKKNENVDFIFDGEVQFDTAIIKSVAEQKSPNSPLKGEANVFIFPDLNAGNIGYKIAQRLANMSAIGPMLQGVKKPVNDLSRGCSDKDIFDVAILTALQAQNIKK